MNSQGKLKKILMVAAVTAAFAVAVSPALYAQEENERTPAESPAAYEAVEEAPPVTDTPPARAEGGDDVSAGSEGDETGEAAERGKPVYGPGSTGAAKGPGGGETEAPGEPAEEKKRKQPAGCFGAGNYSSLIFLVLMFAVFYFLLIRPQQKKQKEHQEMLSALKVGDRVLTTGGILGKITGFSDHYAVLEIQEKVRIKVLRSSLSGKAGGSDKPGNK